MEVVPGAVGVGGGDDVAARCCAGAFWVSLRHSDSGCRDREARAWWRQRTETRDLLPLVDLIALLGWATGHERTEISFRRAMPG
jgi:hypothetical protein